MRRLFVASTLVIGLCGASTVWAQDADSVRQSQQALKDKGYDPGPVDGVNGPKTRTALRQYQQKENLNEDGQLGPQTKDRLGVKPAGSGTEMKEAGSNMKHSYGNGGKDVGHGAKEMGSDVKNGHPVQAGKDLGKGVGHGVAKMGVGTGQATKNAAKGTKDAVTGEKKDQPK